MEVLPKILYRFRPLASESNWDRLTEILRDRKLWFSSVDKFNDPFEGRVSLRVPPGDRARAWMKDVATRLASGNRAERRSIRKTATRSAAHGIEINDRLTDINSIGVCCFMEATSSLLAWSHYAAGHRGVALGFRVKSSLPTNVLSFAHQVIYKVDKPSIDVVRDSRSKSFDAAILTKSECWKYEREWRVLADPEVPQSQAHGARANAAAKFDHDDLVEIHLGVCMSTVEKHKLAQLVVASGLQPKYQQASLHPTKFELVFTPWNP